MLFENCLYFETQTEEELDRISLEGYLGCYPVSYYIPFKEKDAYIDKNDVVGFKTSLKEAKKQLEKRIKYLDLSTNDSYYDITIKEIVEVIKEKINQYPEEAIIHLFIGKFGDVMTINNVQNEIENKLKNYYKFSQISSEKADEIIEKRVPLGKFYLFDDKKWIGIDNEDGNAWTEEFFTKTKCLNWLLGLEDEEENNTDKISQNDEVQELKSNILETAEKQKISKKFKTEEIFNKPAVKIINIETGKETIVPLFAYKEVKKALNELFDSVEEI